MADYTGDKDIDALLRELYARVDDILSGDFQFIVDRVIQTHVQSDVYDVYTPHTCPPGGGYEYKRRKTNGGIQDTRYYNHFIKDHTLRVVDDRHEVGVVESGEGYTWVPVDESHIQMWHMPRPYFENAEEEIANDPVYTQYLIDELSK